MVMSILVLRKKTSFSEVQKQLVKLEYEQFEA